MLGGSGATMPPPGCEISRAIIDAFVAGDFGKAARAQKDFALFPARWMHRGLAPAMKAAMKLIGLDAGAPYPPYQALTPEEMQGMEQVFRKSTLAPRLGKS